MIVVADAGPLIHLGAIGQLELIHRLSPEVLVPRAVFDEVVPVASTGGEAEAIAVAVERHADRLLIDERQGRMTAEAMGVPVVGSVGVLIAAKVRGDIAAIAPLLTALRTSGLWLSDAVVARVLASVGEAPGT